MLKTKTFFLSTIFLVKILNIDIFAHYVILQLTMNLSIPPLPIMYHTIP